MSRSARKWEHIRHALAALPSGNQGLDDVHFIPNSLPNICYGNIDIQTRLGAIVLTSPIIINAMTGGAEPTTGINQKLAVLARERKLAMAVGSQMAAWRDPAVADSYRVVRKENPGGVIFANLGAEASVEQAKWAVEMLEADALQLHLNVMQELLMPEGDRDFRGYLDHIEWIASALSVPVIVKEVGFGMARDTIRQLCGAGVTIIDLGGAGGTNFAQIENRRGTRPFAMFESWGLSTVQSLLEAGESGCGHAAFVATGGLRHGLDIAKALALGASAVGMAGFFLRLVQTETLEGCLAAVDELHEQLRIAMTALGAPTVADLRRVSLTIGGETAVWAAQRGIDCARYALRAETGGR